MGGSHGRWQNVGPQEPTCTLAFTEKNPSRTDEQEDEARAPQNCHAAAASILYGHLDVHRLSRLRNFLAFDKALLHARSLKLKSIALNACRRCTKMATTSYMVASSTQITSRRGSTHPAVPEFRSDRKLRSSIEPKAPCGAAGARWRANPRPADGFDNVVLTFSAAAVFDVCVLIMWC